MYFEVLIPSDSPDGADRLMKVEAPNWLEALRMGLRTLGIPPESVNRQMARITDEQIEVTDRAAGRTYVLRELAPDEVRQSGVLPAHTPQAAAPAPKPQAAAPAPKPQASPRAVSGSAKAVGYTDRSTGAFKAIGATEIATRSEGARVLQDTARRTGALKSIGPRTGSYAPIEDVFLEIGQIFNGSMEIEDALDFVIDLCKRAIRCEHAMILFASDDASHLYVAVARSDVRAAIEELQFPMDRGLPSAALKEGVALTSDMPSRDPRHANTLAKAGVDERAVLCAPVQHEGRCFGIIYQVNPRNTEDFSPEEAGIAHYIGAQLGHFIQNHLHNQADDVT